MAGSRPGRAPKPSALKRLEGVRPSRINDAEPVPALGEVLPPEWLPERARAVWDRLAPDMIRKSILTPWDTDAFAALCCTIVVNADAQVDIDRNGATVTAVVRVLADGTICTRLTKNPAWAVARESAVTIANLGGRFGMNPSDRAQLHVEPASDSAFDDLLSGGADGRDPRRLLDTAAQNNARRLDPSRYLT